MITNNGNREHYLDCRMWGHKWPRFSGSIWAAFLVGCVANICTSVGLQVLGASGIIVGVAAIGIGVAGMTLYAFIVAKRGIVCRRCGTKRTWR